MAKKPCKPCAAARRMFPQLVRRRLEEIERKRIEAANRKEASREGR